MRVTNSGAAAGTVRLYGVDATTGRTSGAVYRSRQDERKDVGSWLTLGSDELTLQAGENRVVPVTVQVPASVRPGQHLGGIVAENTAVQQATGGGAVQVNIQNLAVMAVQVNLIGGAAVEQIDASGVKAQGGGGYQALAVALRNSGKGAKRTRPLIAGLALLAAILVVAGAGFSLRRRGQLSA